MIQKFNEHKKYLISENFDGNFYGIDDKWIEIWNDVKHIDISKMDWIDIIVLLGREFNPPTKRK